MRIELTLASHALFMEYARDADNWDGNPWVSEGNVRCGRQRRGNVSDLIKKGLITTDEYEPGSDYVVFTDEGKRYAASHGVDLFWIS